MPTQSTSGLQRPMARESVWRSLAPSVRWLHPDQEAVERPVAEMSTMLTVVPKGWFASDFIVMEGEWPVAATEVSWWREGGALVIRGTTYRVHPEGQHSDTFILELGGSVLVRAEESGGLRTSFKIELGGRQYTLRAKSVFRKALLLLDGPREVGLLSPEWIFSRRINVHLPEDLPLPAKVFIIWLAVLAWHREDQGS